MNMKLLTTSICFSILSLSSVQTAAKEQISGSDTLGGVMTDAIIASGLDNLITYIGGGSGVGEKALINGEIGLTAMSREFKPELIAQAQGNGITPLAHRVALDGLVIFAHQSNPIQGVDLATLSRIFTCEYTNWAQVPNSGKNGAIHAFRRNDSSGTTDTFKSLTGVKKFGECVVVLNETADIAEKTSLDSDSIGFAGLSGKRQGNRGISIAKKQGESFIAPNASTIRSGSYPLARGLYIYEASGRIQPSAIEAQLLEQLLDRSFLDPILQDHDFITID